MINLTYYKKNQRYNIIRAKDKQKLREQANDEYRNLSEEEKNKKREYGKNRYHNRYVWGKETKSKRISKKLLRA